MFPVPPSGDADQTVEASAIPSKPTFTCRVIYLQATTETDQAISDSVNSGTGDGLAVRYATTSW
jgi:hypothetical protein